MIEQIKNTMIGTGEEDVYYYKVSLLKEDVIDLWINRMRYNYKIPQADNLVDFLTNTRMARLHCKYN